MFQALFRDLARAHRKRRQREFQRRLEAQAQHELLPVTHRSRPAATPEEGQSRRVCCVRGRGVPHPAAPATG